MTRRTFLMPLRLATGLFLIGTAASLLSGPVLAVEADPVCVVSAVHELGFCRAVCQSNFRTARDLCRNVDHDCAETCREGLEGCLDGPDGPLTRLEDCRDGCLSQKEADVTNCRNTTTLGTPERDACIDAAQTVAFQCRDTCREGVATDIAACRSLFRQCVLACPAPTN